MASVLDKVKSLFSRERERAAPSGSPLAAFETGLLASSAGRGPPKRGTRELIQLYNQSPWLRSVTSRIARGVQSTSWCVYVRSKERAPASKSKGRGAPAWRWGVDRAVPDSRLASPVRKVRAERRAELLAAGTLREVVDHPMLALLRRPNEFFRGAMALKLTQIWLDIKGESFWLLAFGDDGTPRAAYPLPPHWVTQVPTAAKPTFTVSTGAGVHVEVDPKAMLWLKDADPANPYGRGSGIAESLGDELETDEFAAKYLRAWFFNNALPSVIVSFEGNATKDQLREARDEWERSHRGVHNAHRAHFAAGKMAAVKLDTSFKDQEIVDLRRMERDTVIQVFGVPPETVGIIENSNRATIDAADYMLIKGVIHPRVDYLRGELEAELLPLYPGGEVAVLEAEISEPEDKGHRIEVMKAQQGAFTLNEWREEAGADPLPELEGQFPAALPGQQAKTEQPKPPETDGPDDESKTEVEPEDE
jgi:HK97 family phage portal protein